MTSTFNAYEQFDPKRANGFSGLEAACGVLDGLGCSDLSSVLTVMSDVRAEAVPVNAILKGNRFSEESAVSPRVIHWLEGVIMDTYPDEAVEFVELSPLQPFGTNKVLAGTNQKNVVSTSRNSEVIADIATALFRVGIQRFVDKPETVSSVTVASNARLTRAQMYGEGSRFLPHFRMFGEVTIGSRSEELDYLAGHLGSKFDIISTLAASDRTHFGDIGVNVGNLALLNDLIGRGVVDAEELRRNIRNPNYKVFADQGLDIPEFLPLDTPDLEATLKDLGFERGVSVTQRMKLALERNRPDLVPQANLHLGRTASNGYYDHICFDISTTDAEGNTFSVAGGGSTDWAIKANQKKGIATVVSTVSTDQICRSLVT